MTFTFAKACLWGKTKTLFMRSSSYFLLALSGYGSMTLKPPHTKSCHRRNMKVSWEHAGRIGFTINFGLPLSRIVFQ
jgi:hypothetical protein